MILLKEITEENFRQIVRMKVSTDQEKYVASNVYSLAQAWLCGDEARPYAIYNDDAPVGFVMLGWGEGGRIAGLWRLMIDKEHQNKGFGRAAIRLIIDMIAKADKFDLIHLYCAEDNEVAKRLYHSFGFAENGEIEDGEIGMVLPLTDDPKLGMLTADMDDLNDFLELLEGKDPIINEAKLSTEDKPGLESAIRRKTVSRFTLMGKTIGFCYEGKIVFCKAKEELLSEAGQRLQALLL